MVNKKCKIKLNDEQAETLKLFEGLKGYILSKKLPGNIIYRDNVEFAKIMANGGQETQVLDFASGLMDYFGLNGLSIGGLVVMQRYLPEVIDNVYKPLVAKNGRSQSVGNQFE